LRNAAKVKQAALREGSDSVVILLLESLAKRKEWGTIATEFNNFLALPNAEA